MSKLVCFVHSALATMGASCGTFHIGICLISVLHGVKGATENAGLELNGPTKFGGWKMQDWN